MKKLCLILALIMLVSVFGGCKRETGGSVDINVVTVFDSTDGNYQNYLNAYTAYEEDTGNTVSDKSSASNEEWKKQVLADFENGNEADVLFFFTGADADEIVNAGKVIPISEIRREYPDYASNMKDSMMPVSTADGRQYAVPVNGYWEGLFVNKAVIEACGLEVPSADYTWTEFLNDCEVIKNAGYTPVACSLYEVPHYWFEFCTLNHGTVYNHATLPQSSEDEIGVIWTDGLNDIKTLYELGYLPENTLTMTDGESNLLMTDNKAAFMIDGSWKVGWFQQNATDIGDFTVTYVPGMGERRATDIVGGLSMGYYITRKAWNDPAKRQACVDFVTAMTTDEVVSTFGALSVTALKNGTSAPEDADSLVMSALEMTKGCTGIVLAVQDGLSPSARDNLFANVPRIAQGEIAAEQAIDECLAIRAGQTN